MHAHANTHTPPPTTTATTTFIYTTRSNNSAQAKKKKKKEETYSLLVWNTNSLWGMWVYYTANENDKARYVLKTSAFYDSTFTVPTFSCTDWTSLTQSKVCVLCFCLWSADWFVPCGLFQRLKATVWLKVTPIDTLILHLYFTKTTVQLSQ